MPDAASIPRPEKEVLEERVRRLVGQTVDQVWYRESEDFSEKEPWSALAGQRISGVRYYWRLHEGGERRACIPRDLEIALEDGYRLYLSAAHPGKHEEDVSYLDQLTVYHGARAAWQFQIGPFADGTHPTGSA